MALSNILHTILDPIMLRKFSEYEKGKLEAMLKNDKLEAVEDEIMEMQERANMVLDTVFPVPTERVKR
jgi:hypothetical protein